MTNDEDAQRPQVPGLVYRAISTFIIRHAGLPVGAGAHTGRGTGVDRHREIKISRSAIMNTIPAVRPRRTS